MAGLNVAFGAGALHLSVFTSIEDATASNEKFALNWRNP
jgi:hypothetical protein